MAGPWDEFSAKPWEDYGKPGSIADFPNAPGFVSMVKRTAGKMLTTGATSIEDLTGPNRVTRAVRDFVRDQVKSIEVQPNSINIDCHGNIKRILIQLRKGSGAPFRLLPGLILHDDSGAYTRDADAILRGKADSSSCS